MVPQKPNSEKIKKMENNQRFVYDLQGRTADGREYLLYSVPFPNPIHKMEGVKVDIVDEESIPLVDEEESGMFPNLKGHLEGIVSDIHHNSTTPIGERNPETPLRSTLILKRIEIKPYKNSQEELIEAIHKYFGKK